MWHPLLCSLSVAMPPKDVKDAVEARPVGGASARGRAAVLAVVPVVEKDFLDEQKGGLSEAAPPQPLATSAEKALWFPGFRDPQLYFLFSMEAHHGGPRNEQ